MQISVKNLTTLKFDNPYLPRSSCRWHRQRQQRRTIDTVKRAGSASRQENRASVDLKHNHDTGKHANQPACIDGLSPNHDGELETWFSPFAKRSLVQLEHCCCNFMQQSRRFFIKLMKLFLTGGRAIHTWCKLFYDF
jgi:hypothetical protein